MYILQFCNTFTQEIIREDIYQKPDIIENIIESFNNGTGLNTIIIDSKKQIQRISYATYKVYPDGNDIIYKLFFRVHQVEAQL